MTRGGDVMRTRRRSGTVIVLREGEARIRGVMARDEIRRGLQEGQSEREGANYPCVHTFRGKESEGVDTRSRIACPSMAFYQLLPPGSRRTGGH